MTAFPKTRQNSRQIFPFPAEGNIVYETPPCFSWLSAGSGLTYRVIIKSGSETVCEATTRDCFFVPDAPLSPGAYSWNVFADGAEKGEVEFSISTDARVLRRPNAKELYDSVPDLRPRHLFYKCDIDEIKKNRAPELATLRRNVEAAYKAGLPEPPRFHRDEKALPYREYFGQWRDFTDRDLVACSLAYSFGDTEAGAHAKKLLLNLCDLSPNGPCSLLGPWGDEIGLSNARVLPSVFDLLYDLLSENERLFVARCVASYAYQCEERLIAADFCQYPGESHSGRIPAYLGEAALSLKGTGVVSEEVLLRWLGFALRIYGGIFPFYGTTDGGWAEGAFYATSYTKWYLPFFSAVERYCGFSFLERPFYRNLARFMMYFASSDYENHPFGDGYWCGSEDAEWPGFFAQNPFRVYAEKFGPPEALALMKKAASPKLFSLHLLDIFLPVKKSDAMLPPESGKGAVFPEAGFISLRAGELTLLARASRFGSGSHRHPDQGSFALYIGGKAMISPSGYFGRQYGSAHHMKWLNSTKAHNSLLIDGIGQPSFSHLTTGKIISCGENEALLDLSEAYPSLAPGFSWQRHFSLTPDCLTLTDRVVTPEESVITFPLHTLSLPEAQEDGTVVVNHGEKTLKITPIDGVGGVPVISDKFDTPLNEGEPAEYAVEMPPQYHIYYETPKSVSHIITFRFAPQ